MNFRHNIPNYLIFLQLPLINDNYDFLFAKEEGIEHNAVTHVKSMTIYLT